MNVNSCMPSGRCEVFTCRPPVPSGAARSPLVSRSRRCRLQCSASASNEVTLLDYGAGNVRSVRNAIKKLGFTIKDVSAAE